MGQQPSKSQALTCGYINHKQQDEIPIEQFNGKDRNHTPDFVLDNPHLYKFEISCQHCSKDSHSKLVVAEQITTTCKFCKQNKRLSLVRQDLASDLNYIDETYYPDIVHYEEDESEEENQEESDYIVSDEENDTDTLRDEEGWSKLTLGEITSSTPKSLVPSTRLWVDLSGKSLIKLSSSIGYLNNLTKLDLSDNQMINLPKAIGQLNNLIFFNASKNQLESIPETIVGLKKLKVIILNQNRLVQLPKGIGNLTNLILLKLDENQFTEIPREIANLNNLLTLNVSNNPLKSIPAEIARLKTLRKFTAGDCAFDTEFVYDLTHNPPSLFEICARNIAKSKQPLPSYLSNHPIADYFKKEQKCSFCYGPYFDSFVMRGKFIERTNRQLIALDYKLCCAHWSDEEDRIFSMFSTPCIREPTQELLINDDLLTPSSLSTTTDEMLAEQDYFHHQHNNTEQSLSNHHSTTTITSSSSSYIRRPRSSSTSSSSLLRIHTMQQQLQHHLSTTFLRHSNTEESEESFVTLNSSQSEQVDRHRSSPLSEELLEGPVRRVITKKSSTRVIKDSFAQLGARLSRRRDRSETV